jgi:hypothetical protein
MWYKVYIYSLNLLILSHHYQHPFLQFFFIFSADLEGLSIFFISYYHSFSCWSVFTSIIIIMHSVSISQAFVLGLLAITPLVSAFEDVSQRSAVSPPTVSTLYSSLYILGRPSSSARSSSPSPHRGSNCRKEGKGRKGGTISRGSRGRRIWFMVRQTRSSRSRRVRFLD